MSCVHHWVLADGVADVAGRCRECGAERVFRGIGQIDALLRAMGLRG